MSQSKNPHTGSSLEGFMSGEESWQKEREDAMKFMNDGVKASDNVALPEAVEKLSLYDSNYDYSASASANTGICGVDAKHYQELLETQKAYSALKAECERLKEELRKLNLDNSRLECLTTLDNELINDLRNLKYSSINDYNDLHLKFVKIASEKYELVEKNFDNMEKITGLEAENEAIKKAREYYENTISSKRQLIKKYHNKLEDYKSENAALVAENLKLKQELKSSEFTGELAKNAYNRAHAEKEALALENADFRTALEFYADKEKWSDFISNGGVFDEQDGDFVEAFNAMNGDMDQGETARDVLQKHSAGKGEG